MAEPRQLVLLGDFGYTVVVFNPTKPLGSGAYGAVFKAVSFCKRTYNTPRHNMYHSLDGSYIMQQVNISLNFSPSAKPDRKASWLLPG